MAIINPLKVTITNYPENKIEFFQIPFHPNNNSLGQRKVFFQIHLYRKRRFFC